MTGKTDDTTTDDGTPPPAPKPSADNPRTFSQDDVSRISAREKDEGKRSAERAWLDALGVSSLQEAQEALAAKREADEARLSEVDKKEKAATRAQQEAATATAQATKITLDTKVERAIIETLLGEEHAAVIKQAATLRRLVDVPDDADDKAIAEAVTELATTMPQVFTAPQSKPDGNGRPPVKGQPVPPTPPRNTPPSSVDERVRETLHKRHPQLANRDRNDGTRRRP